MVYNQINSSNIDKYLYDLYQEIVKINRNSTLAVDIYIMGGSAVMINNKFREATIDIDAYIRSTIDIRGPVKEVAKQHNLPNDWLNTNVTVTQSFSKKLLQHFKLYKKIGDNLNVYVLDNLAQVCMKLVSYRVDSSDITDIKGIVSSGFNYTYDEVMETITDIYGDDSVISVDAQLFIYNLLSGEVKENKSSDIQGLASKLLDFYK